MQKYTCDHLGTEEEHSVVHKTPIWLVNLSHRLAWAGTLYYFIYMSFFLGDQHQILNVLEKDSNNAGTNDTDIPFRYEQLYFLQRKPVDVHFK